MSPTPTNEPATQPAHPTPGPHRTPPAQGAPSHIPQTPDHFLQQVHNMASAAYTQAKQTAASTDLRLSRLEANISTLTTSCKTTENDLNDLRNNQSTLHDVLQ
eukprot:GFKZ01005868.1.p2 GENE.GFKZ01005868.1~~GFKZ01005868.1.p2  ORF type:complete len:103 (-),score=6.09 GFKZ01005868.1:39-347(-)